MLSYLISCHKRENCIPSEQGAEAPETYQRIQIFLTFVKTFRSQPKQELLHFNRYALPVYFAPYATGAAKALLFSAYSTFQVHSESMRDANMSRISNTSVTKTYFK